MSTSNASLWVRGGRIIDPATRFDATADLLVQDRRVAARGVIPADLVAGVPVLDATGLIVCPGFVDLHTHLRFPGFPEKETIASGTAAAAAGGFTTICAMANTSPVVDSVPMHRMVKDEVEREANVRVHQLAAVSIGLLGETPVDFDALGASGVVAFSDDGKPVWNEMVMRVALRASRRLGKAISVHEEDPLFVGTGVANAGQIARDLGLAEWPCAGETGMIARDVALLADEGGHLHIAHVSCAESVAVIRAAKARGLQISAEVTPHHLTLTDELLTGDDALGLARAHPCTKVNPPLRTSADVAAVVSALAEGTLDAVATDHAPHTFADKELPFAQAAFGFSGIELALPLILQLVRSGQLGLTAAIERLTAGPARAFHLTAGTLAQNAVVDACVFDPDEQWKVTVDDLRSRGKNTPVLGMELWGRVRYTIVGGDVVYRR